MSDSVRSYIVAELALPTDWKMVAEQRLPNKIERPTVVVKHDRIEPLPEAPIGAYRNHVILGLFIPNQDIAVAEDRLDELVADVLARVERHPRIAWTDAQKVVTPDGQFPGWELSLLVITETTLEED